jgi:hypothetical protein
MTRNQWVNTKKLFLHKDHCSELLQSLYFFAINARRICDSFTISTKEIFFANHTDKQILEILITS